MRLYRVEQLARHKLVITIARLTEMTDMPKPRLSTSLHTGPQSGVRPLHEPSASNFTHVSSNEISHKQDTEELCRLFSTTNRSTACRSFSTESSSTWILPTVKAILRPRSSLVLTACRVLARRHWWVFHCFKQSFQLSLDALELHVSESLLFETNYIYVFAFT